ncbi:MAG: DUF5689 domain-containing protein, partial [Sediminibacterium sp.]|nr:DUF5689 domain-containing protein [Sediminibacterium sp.]
LLLIIVQINCNKKFIFIDEVKATNIKANKTIRQIVQIHQLGKFEQIQADWVVEGIVIGNDKENNLYKSLVIQDETAGVVLNIDATNLHTDYPIGSNLIVKLQGLVLGDYNNLIQIGAAMDTVKKYLIGIPQPLINQYLIKKDTIIQPNPLTVTWGQLHDSLQSRLLMLNNIEFIANDTSKTFADYWNSISASRTAHFCNGGNVYVRTSGYADFANQKIPNGNGTIVGIYSVYKNDKQLIIRGAADVQLYNKRCSNTNIDFLMNEDFENYPIDSVFNFGDWQNIAAIGNKRFITMQNSNNKCVYIDAFASNSKIETWLISPSFVIPKNKTTVLQFKSKDGFNNGANLKIYISNN